GVDGAVGELQQPRCRNGNYEDVDEHEIEREHPPCALDLALGVVLDHGDVELPRQQDDADEAQERDGEPYAAVEGPDERRVDLGAMAHALGETVDPAKNGNHDEYADGQKGRELDEGLGGDGQHQAVLVLRGVDVTGAEQDGEGGERYGREESRLAEAHDLRPLVGQVHVADEQSLRRDDDRLGLKGDVGQRADDRNDGYNGGHGLALPVARRKEVGHRGDVLAFRQADDPQDQRPAEREHQDRADVDGNE